MTNGCWLGLANMRQTFIKGSLYLKLPWHCSIKKVIPLYQLSWVVWGIKTVRGRRHQIIFSYFRLNYIKVSEKAMAPHSSTLAWKIPWAEEPGRLQSMGSHRVGHD